MVEKLIETAATIAAEHPHFGVRARWRNLFLDLRAGLAERYNLPGLVKQAEVLLRQT